MILRSDALEVIAPDAIVNAAGKTDLAWCEANAREAIRSNLEAPVRLYERMLLKLDNPLPLGEGWVRALVSFIFRADVYGMAHILQMVSRLRRIARQHRRAFTRGRKPQRMQCFWV